jgi:hypothetical protein
MNYNEECVLNETLFDDEASPSGDNNDRFILKLPFTYFSCKLGENAVEFLL